MLLQQRSFDPVFDDLMSFTDPSGLIYISHNIVGLWNTQLRVQCPTFQLVVTRATAGATVTTVEVNTAVFGDSNIVLYKYSCTSDFWNMNKINN